MRILKKRIRNIWPYLNQIKFGEQFFIGVSKIEGIEEKLIQLGFSNEINIGEKILPMPKGPISHYNAEGIFEPQKDKPKETYYQEREWHWKDWGGYKHSKIVYIERERYPRIFHIPPSEELQIIQHQYNKMLISSMLIKQMSNESQIKHIINLFLELFGECEILDKNFAPYINENVIRLNWKLLPVGEYPWEKVKNEVKEAIKRQPTGNQPVISHNLQSITKYIPKFVAIGQGGFNDYLIFGFPNKNLFILESMKAGNATYIFEKDWEELSKLTKKEILDNNFQLDRLIHKDGWENSINRFLN